MTQDELIALINQAADEGWTELDLAGHNLTELPPEIGRLTQLETLILGRQKKDSKGQPRWRYKGDRYVAVVVGNDLMTLPTEIKALKNLKNLDISGNPWGSFPPVVTELNSLEKLTSVESDLMTIPEAIAQLSNLTMLSLHSNQITTIPEAIAQLSNLTTLNLRDNKIEDIPICLESLPQLTKLDLRRNPLSISPEVLGPANIGQDPGLPEDIFNYCRELRSGEKR
jgi:internalin A